MPSDRDRHDLFLVLQRRLGDRAADTMMDLLPPVGWADLARRADVDAVRVELKADLREVHADLKLELAALQTRMLVANVAMACAVGGLVLAAFKLA
jgi:hypothetical protein